MIAVQHLRKAYGDVVAVDDVTFTAAAGAIFGLLGPNGAGKSTTIGCISGLLKPGGGRITVMVLAPLGGAWWPIEIAPAFMQKLALFVPTGWTMDALHKLVSFRDSAVSALPQVLALAAGAFVLGLVSVRTFRYQ